MNHIIKVRKLVKKNDFRAPYFRTLKNIGKPKKNDRILSGRSFWWEWLDSNQLRLKPTDLQSAPALQLRRTPNLVKNCQKSENATILMQAVVQGVHDRNQNQADSIFHNFLVRAAGNRTHKDTMSYVISNELMSAS